jgi:hypothetical protein
MTNDQFCYRMVVARDALRDLAPQLDKLADELELEWRKLPAFEWGDPEDESEAKECGNAKYHRERLARVFGSKAGDYLIRALRANAWEGNRGFDRIHILSQRSADAEYNVFTEGFKVLVLHFALGKEDSSLEVEPDRLGYSYANGMRFIARQMREEALRASTFLINEVMRRNAWSRAAQAAGFGDVMAAFCEAGEENRQELERLGVNQGEEVPADHPRFSEVHEIQTRHLRRSLAIEERFKLRPRRPEYPDTAPFYSDTALEDFHEVLIDRYESITSKESSAAGPAWAISSGVMLDVAREELRRAHQRLFLRGYADVPDVEGLDEKQNVEAAFSRFLKWLGKQTSREAGKSIPTSQAELAQWCDQRSDDLAEHDGRLIGGSGTVELPVASMDGGTILIYLHAPSAFFLELQSLQSAVTTHCDVALAAEFRSMFANEKIRTVGDLRLAMKWLVDRVQAATVESERDQTCASTRRGRRESEWTAKRREFALPRRAKRHTWQRIYDAYYKKHPDDANASAATIRLSCSRKPLQKPTNRTK